uniref:Neurotransmitter-gated ion-channel transmembrane domain-containing protein n=1 Tax=Anopheles maculatus TaxID=74869 RepID=A0A182S5Z1_9DIPT
MDEKSGSNIVDVGVDLSEFYMSVEWDILEVPAVRNEKFYTCCDEPYLDITFNITMRRKTLFYTVNIIIPCMGISFLTVLTFYLPSDSGEKVTLSISILISLHVFFLLVVEIIPPTSLVVPLLGKYLIFAMILVSIRLFTTISLYETATIRRKPQVCTVLQVARTSMHSTTFVHNSLSLSLLQFSIFSHSIVYLLLKALSSFHVGFFYELLHNIRFTFLFFFPFSYNEGKTFTIFRCNCFYL